MSNHRILLNYTFSDIKRKASDADVVLQFSEVTHIGSARNFVKDFMTFAAETQIDVINTVEFTDEMFAVFLKALEASTKGTIWFYGREGSGYPLTVRSRCVVDTFLSASVEQVREYLAKIGEQHDLSLMLHLSHYGMEGAHEIISRKEEFTDFLINLENAKTLEAVKPAILRFDKWHINLLLEWLHSNDIFTERELAMCDFLRSPRFQNRISGFVSLREELMCEAIFLSAFLSKVIEA